MPASATQGEGVRVGLMPSPQFTTWPQLEAVAREADEAGIDELWVSDHLLAPYGRSDGDVFEAFTTLAAWAAGTRRATLGTMVAANRFRAPTLLAKMITGIDHISGGRAVLGLGAGWFEREHRAFGLPFGTIGERLDALEAALPVVRAMLHRGAPAAAGAPPNRPAPVQRHLPLLVGASGERRGLRLVAEHADVWNTPGSLDVVAAKRDALHRWCDTVGRDPGEIALSYHVGPVLIRDDPQAARSVLAAQAERIGATEFPGLYGPPELVAETLREFVALGFRRIYVDVVAPYDVETIHRLVTDVAPLLAGVPAPLAGGAA